MMVYLNSLFGEHMMDFYNGKSPFTPEMETSLQHLFVVLYQWDPYGIKESIGDVKRQIVDYHTKTSSTCSLKFRPFHDRCLRLLEEDGLFDRFMSKYYASNVAVVGQDELLAWLPKVLSDLLSLFNPKRTLWKPKRWRLEI